uniref:ankyrin repeat domain-containing protein n=1 Tax=Burkholderia anthina TaxID=179879 RepID=UPI00158B244A|nr:ankyrin repeat domain-containing protein [Burkholderia anthina]
MYEIYEFYRENINRVKKFFELVKNGEVDELRIMSSEEPKLLRCPMFGIEGNREPLHFAALNGQTMACELFIDLGIDVNVDAPYVGHTTPLSDAASSGCLALVKSLINRGASVDGLPISIVTPLMNAVINNHYQTTLYLLESGAEINRLHLKTLQTSLDLSVAWGHREIEDLLIHHGGISANPTSIDWSKEAGGSIVSHVNQVIGPVLPAGLMQIVPGADVKIRIARVNGEGNLRVLFTVGLFLYQMIEFSICLPPEWPIFTGAKQLGDQWEFPTSILNRLSGRVIRGENFKEGLIIDRKSEEWSDLRWPGKLNGLALINHRWSEDSCDLTGDDAVIIYTLAPVTNKEYEFQSGKKLSDWIEKRRREKWGKMAIPMP